MIKYLIPSLFLFVACSSNTQEAIQQEGTQQESVTTSDSVPAVSQQAIPATEPGTPAANSNPFASASDAPNPAHGEPGHRCDIAVGAPLNSPPGNGSNLPAQPQMINAEPQVNATQPATGTVVQPTTPAATTPAPPTVTLPGMNPPHGEPGHDCAIPVGEPLKKK